jgi:hypothetical protein
MALTYEWKLTGLRKQQTATLDNVVVGTFWKVTGTDEDGNTGEFSGATPFELSTVNTSSFTTYSELSEEQVLGWVKQRVSGSALTAYWDHIDDVIKRDIDSKKYTRVMVMESDLPWSPTSGSNAYGVDPQPV